MSAAVIALLLGACRIDFDPIAGGVDALTVPTGPWGQPTPLVATAAEEDDGSIAPNGLELVFTYGAAEIDFLTRANPAASWTGTLRPFEQNQGAYTATPRWGDDTTLYFTNDGDVKVSHRAAIGAPWEAATTVDYANDPSFEEKWFTPCGQRYFIVSTAAGSDDLYEGTIGSPPVRIDALATSGNESSPFVLPGCTTLLYTTNGVDGQGDIYEVTRATIDAPWGTPRRVDEIDDATADDEDPWISPDGHLLLFTSTRSGSSDIYTATR